MTDALRRVHRPATRPHGHSPSGTCGSVHPVGNERPTSTAVAEQEQLDSFQVGPEGARVVLQFPADEPPIPEGMYRTYDIRASAESLTDADVYSVAFTLGRRVVDSSGLEHPTMALGADCRL